MRNRIAIHTALFLLAALLVGCNGGDDGTVGTGVLVRLTGAVQKGPFVIGSRIIVTQLHEDGLPVFGEVGTTETENDLGDFTLSLPGDKTYEVTADGYHLNELTGNLSQGTLLLRSVFSTNAKSTATTNVNILTHLMHGRVLHLMKDGVSAPVATAQAQAEIVDTFSSFLPVLELSNFSSYSLYDRTNSGDLGNAYLLAVSAMFYKYATLRDSGSVDAQLVLALNAFSADFSKDGDIDTAGFIDSLAAAIRDINPDQIAINLKQRSLYAINLELAVPDINQVIDTDDDGTLNIDDTDDDNDTIPDAVDPNPYMNAGGQDLTWQFDQDQLANVTGELDLTITLNAPQQVKRVTFFTGMAWGTHEQFTIGSATTAPFTVHWNPYFSLFTDNVTIETFTQIGVLIEHVDGSSVAFEYIGTLSPDILDSQTLSPARGTAVTAGSRPTLSWLPVTGAVQYRVEIYCSFTPCALGDSYSQTMTSTSLQMPLITEPGDYQWCVQAENEYGLWGIFFPCNSFTIVAPP